MKFTDFAGSLVALRHYLMKASAKANDVRLSMELESDEDLFKANEAVRYDVANLAMIGGHGESLRVERDPQGHLFFQFQLVGFHIRVLSRERRHVNEPLPRVRSMGQRPQQ